MSIHAIPAKALLACYVILAILLLGTVIVSPDRPIYDEPFHLAGAQMLLSGSSIHDIWLAPLPSAPGPTYPVLHFLASPLTHLQAPQVRYVNLLLLLCGIIATGYSMRLTYDDRSWLASAAMLGIPMTWVTAGMALTEIPAFTMASFSLAAAVWAMKRPIAAWACYIAFALSAVFAGFAILGRQTYLPILTGFGAVAVWNRNCRYPALIGLTICCAVVAPVFAAWQGLTPPSQAHIGGETSVEHGLLSIAYLAVVIAILAPGYYATRWRYIVAAVTAGFTANLLLMRFEWVAATGIAKSLPESIRERYPLLVGSCLVALLIGFGGSTLLQFWARRSDRVFVVAGTITLLLASTAFGITHLFSSRYVMVAFPSVFFVIQPFFAPSAWAAFRVTAGAALGWASLCTYYWPR